MKVLLYFEAEKLIGISGIGRAQKHQMMALESAGVDYTTNPNEDYDLLHINTVLFSSNAMIQKAKKEGKPIIYHAHSTEEDFRNSYIFSNQVSPLFKKHLIALYSKANEIITPTPYSKKLLEGYGIDKPITAISNGIDLSRFRYDEEKIKAYRRYFNIQDDDKVIISVGLLFERKGILEFFEVAKALPEYKFIWFGTTASVSIPKKISDAIENRPMNVIMPGYVKGAIIEGAYLDADCFFFPSHEETEGIVVLEALAAKQQVILNDIGAFDPWMKDGLNCYKGKNVQDFIRLIKAVIEGTLKDTKKEAYLTAKERSISEIGKQLKEVYLRVYEDKKAQ